MRGGILHGLEYRSDQSVDLESAARRCASLSLDCQRYGLRYAPQWRGLIGNALDFSEVLGINLGELSSKLRGIENVVPWRYYEIISHDLRQRSGFRISQE